MADRSEDPEAPDTTGATVARMKAQGTWNPLWDGLEHLAPTWTEKFMAAAMDPYESTLLSPQTVQLLCIAVDASCTHLYAPGVRRHIRAALDLGVSPEQIMEVLKLTTTVGIHSCNIAIPLLLEEMNIDDTASDGNHQARRG